MIVHLAGTPLCLFEMEGSSPSPGYCTTLSHNPYAKGNGTWTWSDQHCGKDGLALPELVSLTLGDRSVNTFQSKVKSRVRLITLMERKEAAGRDKEKNTETREDRLDPLPSAISVQSCGTSHRFRRRSVMWTSVHTILRRSKPFTQRSRLNYKPLPFHLDQGKDDVAGVSRLAFAETCRVVGPGIG